MCSGHWSSLGEILIRRLLRDAELGEAERHGSRGRGQRAGRGRRGAVALALARFENARRRAQPVKGAGDGSNKAQKNVVNKKKKSGKGDDSDDDEGSKAQKDLMKKKKEEEAAMRAKLGKKK